jgi:phage tail sheath protein FI
MPVSVSYPGVYIEEIPSAVRTIIGVSTSVTAFIGSAPKGPLDQAVKIYDYGSYERTFGGLTRDGELGFAVQQFFLNGGTEAWVIRVAKGAAAASVQLKNKSGGTVVLTASVATAGVWGNLVRLDVDNGTTNPDSLFNLAVTEYVIQSGALTQGRQEQYLNLSMDSNSADYAVNSVNSVSQLLRLTRPGGATAAMTGNGTALSGNIGTLLSGLPGSLTDATRSVQVSIDGDGPYEIEIFPQGSVPADAAHLVSALQAKIQAINPGLHRFANVTVQRATVLGAADAAGVCLLVTSGSDAADREKSSVHFYPASKNDASRILKLGLAAGGREFDAAGAMRPDGNGTRSLDLAALDLSTLNTAHQVKVTAADGAVTLGTGTFTLGTAVTTIGALAAQLQSQIRSSNTTLRAISQVVVEAEGTYLRVVSGDPASPNAKLTFADQGGGTLASDLKLSTGDVNLARYAPGSGVDDASQTNPVPGNDGTAPGATELMGNQDAKTGMYALENVDIFNLLSIPRTGDLANSDALAVISAATAYATSKRAFYIVDVPRTVNTVSGMQDFVSNQLTPSNYAAVYFPYLLVPDPTDKYRLRSLAPSGTVAGVYARTDTARGVWKAPAGIDATLVNVPDLAVPLTDMENGSLNELGVNCLRQFPVYGRIAWGARTLRGADQLADQYKYIPVRRLALYLEESLYRNSKWIVFEPNDFALWAQIRLNFGAFLQGLFLQGAFQGQTPKEAYFVKCDSETTTQNDINSGIVNIVVGFAPLKPAEFVIIQIQQIAGQVTT